MHIRAQNAALIVRRLATADFVQFEVFEVLPLISAVMEAEGRLLCSYPGPAIQVPADIFTDECFLRELSSFLAQMDVDLLNPAPTRDSPFRSSYDGAHPGYISELLVGILRGYGQPAVITRITKRIGDEVLLEPPGELSLDRRLWDNLPQWRDKLLRRRNELKQNQPWRRSPLWLILRVSLQSSLGDSNLYKPFILFFHAHLLRRCVRRDISSGLLHVMRVKMARRLSKLGPLSHHIYQFVHDTAKATETLLSKRWTVFQDIGPISPRLQLKGRDFVADSNISLDNSYNYLTKMLRSPPRGFTHNRFSPSSTSRFYEVHDFTQFGDGRLAKAIAEDPHIAMADFELSVEKNLESWVAGSTNDDDALDVIASCIEQYFSGAKGLYKDNPEDNSIMILTIMDLWVVLDRITVRACPLLKEYSPEIPSNFLHSLLLHRSSALTHALHIEEYLCQRHKDVLDVPSIFSNSIDNSCFAVKYFTTSMGHQRLYDEINMHAQQERATKQEELASLKQKSNSFLGRAWKMDHEQSENSSGRKVHSATCRRCQLENRARDLRIRVHEWPLPLSTTHAQLAVFELSPPHAFCVWRDITYMILCDIGLPSVSHSLEPRPTFLDVFSGLRPWVVQRRQHHRVTIASTTPSNTGPDDMALITAEETSIFVDNRLSFRLFDVIHDSWVIESFSDSSPTSFCVPPIPESNPYSHLHRFIVGTEHTPNDIIAAQADCPEQINLHEFIAFSGLRSGPRLQWPNIARELASPFLSFSRGEVHTLIAQAAWQLGPLSDGIREWHADLGVLSFGKVLLHEMECLLEKIKMNWLEEVTVRTIGVSDSSYPHLCLICTQLLSVAVSWRRQWTRTFRGGHIRCCGRLEI